MLHIILMILSLNLLTTNFMGNILHGSLSTSAPNGNLVYNNITGALLSEESRRKTMGSSHHGEAHYVQKESKQRQGCNK